jgi:hypothetical protein
MKVKPGSVETEPGLELGMHQGWASFVGGLGTSHEATCAAHVTLALLRRIGVSGESRIWGQTHALP